MKEALAEVALAGCLLAFRRGEAQWVSKPVLIPQFEDSKRFGAIATGAPAFAAQHIVSLWLVVSQELLSKRLNPRR